MTPGSLGLRDATVRVIPYDPGWVAAFECAREELVSALGARALAIHHVGSTSVPGLAAKPVLDLLVGVADLEEAVELVKPLEDLGYRFHSNEPSPDRHYFRRWALEGMRTHHLSLAEGTSAHYLETLAFRDALRRDPTLAAAYGDLKAELARKHPLGRKAYLAGKAGFITRVLAEQG
ncbi:MAG: GrpB family protein [Gemmatimonadetes bacterium]|nr:GrpB family protein [Gemmatimonadota bacterium]